MCAKTKCTQGDVMFHPQPREKGLQVIQGVDAKLLEIIIMHKNM